MNDYCDGGNGSLNAKAMRSRWDSLKFEKEEEKGKSTNAGAWRSRGSNDGGRDKRWTQSSNSNATHRDGTELRQPRFRGSFLQQQKQKQQDHQRNPDRWTGAHYARRPVFDPPTNTEARKSEQNAQPPSTMSMAERAEVVESLKSQLFRYQSSEDNSGHDESVLVDNLTKLLRDDATTLGAPCRQKGSRSGRDDSDLFLTLLGLLEIRMNGTKHKYNASAVTDETDNVRLFLAKSIESCLRHSINNDDNEKISKYKSSSPGMETLALSRSQVKYGISTLLSHYKQLMTMTTTTITTTNTAPLPVSNLQQQPLAAGLLATNSAFLASIALFVKLFANHLAPEWTARNVVGTVFLPHLSSTCRKPEPDTHVTVCVCNALIALLERPSHASAMLAPLVEDVSILPSVYAQEEVANPIRVKLLHSLLEHLKTTDDLKRNLEVESFVCRTLSASIDAIRKLGKGNETNHAGQIKADVQIIMRPFEKFITKVVAEFKNDDSSTTTNSSKSAVESNPLTIASLRLMRALIACYPNEMTGIGWKLIIEGANGMENVVQSRHGSGRRVSSSPVTLSYLPSMVVTHCDDDSVQRRYYIDHDQVALTMDCLADFITLLPWNKWLKQSPFGNARQQSMRSLDVVSPKATTSGLYKTVVNALCTLIGIVKSCFDNCRDKALRSSLGRLVSAIYLEIPYCDTKLIQAGRDLWESIIRAIHGCFEYTASAENSDKQSLAIEILLVSSGGTVTPQGHLRGMSLPARNWFLSGDSFVEMFLKALMDSFDSMDRHLDISVRILSSVLRTLPDVALQRWKAFLQLFDKINTSSTNKNDQVRLEVLESLMLGRKDFDVSSDMKPRNDGIITDLDTMLLRPWSRNGQRRRLTIYSAFRSQDWLQLDRINGRLLDHFQQIVGHCNDSNAKTREAAAKAVGEFCSRYIIIRSAADETLWQTKKETYAWIAEKVCVAMLELCRDQNAAARSMSIFCLGNLTSALKASNSEELLDLTKLQETSNAIFDSLNDANDKVVKNAIRSIGHAGNLLAGSMRCNPKDEGVSSSCGLLVAMVEALTQKLSNTLHVALNEEQKSAMTWKERSAAKKHGWGACHSLGLIFEGLSVELVEGSDSFAAACRGAFRRLAVCLRHREALNEKVVLAAMAALGQLPGGLLVLAGSRGGSLGEALAGSMLLLESSQRARDHRNPHEASPRVAAKNQDLLRHLLAAAPVESATEALTGGGGGGVTPRTLNVLYAWMVEAPQLEVLPARSFEVVSLALRHQERWPSGVVGLEQRFASRAVQKRKLLERPSENRINPSGSTSGIHETRAEGNDEQDEDADEL